jgi:hypothetical protein
MPMITTTISNSIRVNAERERGIAKFQSVGGR